MSENKEVSTEEVETPYTVVQLTEALEERQKPDRRTQQGNVAKEAERRKQERRGSTPQTFA